MDERGTDTPATDDLTMRCDPDCASIASDFLIDVDLHTNIFPWVFVVVEIATCFAVVIGLMILAIKLGMNSWPWPWSMATSIVVATILGLGLWQVICHWRRRAHHRAMEGLHLPDRELAKHIAISRARLPGHWWLPGMLAKALAQAGRTGFVIRCAKASNRTRITPVTVPFEPFELNEADERTAAFDEGVAPLCVRSDDPKDRQEAPHGPLHRRLIRSARMAGGWTKFLIIVLFGAIFVVLYGAGLLLGYIRFPLIGLIGFGMLIWLVGMPQEFWLLVPGGVLVRRVGALSKHKRILHFERTASVLLLIQMSKGSWWVTVGDSERHRTRAVTTAEVNLLLRCWLSPLKPLPLDQYDDLFTDDG